MPMLDLDFAVGSVQPDEIPLLETLVFESNNYPGALIEIGTLIGLTTQRIAAWKTPHQHVVTVDNYSWNPWGLSDTSHHQLATLILGPLILSGDVTLINEDKETFYVTNRSSPALVFLDAIHTYEQTKQDILWAKEMGARIICGRDYGSKFPGVIRAVNEMGGTARTLGTVWELAQ